MSWKQYAALAVIGLCVAAAGWSGMKEDPSAAAEPVPVQLEQEQPEPKPEPEPEPEAVPEPELPPYDFTQPAPEREAVDNTYFEDAAFVGDSRTDGFMIFSGIGRGKNLSSNGLSIFRLETKKALQVGEEKLTLLEALAQEPYNKVYLCLGVNELGINNDEGFYQAYLSAIDAIRAVQPHAVIYIQGLIPLNEEEIAAAGGNTDLTNDHLRVYNELMRRAAEEKQVVYLDLYTEFADENGSLPAGVSRDGVHFNVDYYKKWLEYLKTHTVPHEALGLTEYVAEPADSEENEESTPA